MSIPHVGWRRQAIRVLVLILAAVGGTFLAASPAAAEVRQCVAHEMNAFCNVYQYSGGPVVRVGVQLAPDKSSVLGSVTYVTTGTDFEYAHIRLWQCQVGDPYQNCILYPVAWGYDTRFVFTSGLRTSAGWIYRACAEWYDQQRDWFTTGQCSPFVAVPV
jgi:hypothetical protein